MAEVSIALNKSLSVPSPAKTTGQTLVEGILPSLPNHQPGIGDAPSKLTTSLSSAALVAEKPLKNAMAESWQIPVMLPSAWYQIRVFEHEGRLWNTASKLYQAALLYTVGRIGHISDALHYKIDKTDRSGIEKHILHTKQHEGFHAVTQGVVTLLGLASAILDVPLVGGSSWLHVGVFVGCSAIFNAMSMMHQRAQRGQCERILARLNGRAGSLP